MKHRHCGPNGRVVEHNHQLGDVAHIHGDQKPVDRWRWETETEEPVR